MTRCITSQTSCADSPFCANRPTRLGLHVASQSDNDGLTSGLTHAHVFSGGDP